MSDNCQHCGKPVGPQSIDGLCPECLLKVGLGTLATGGARAFEPPSLEKLRERFLQFEILELLGRGGMGAVYKARQKRLDRLVALKLLPPEIGADPAFAQRFEREARALAKLNHPNIVTLYEFGESDGLYYFLMEYVDGASLRQLLQAGRVAPREALAIVPQICDALQYAHDHGIVHRDIKPENILLDRQGRVKVADFGLAKLVSQSGLGTPPMANAGGPPVPPEATHASLLMGTPQYMAPEQRERPSEVDHRADIYSLGVVFYQMLTGELPKGDFAPPSKKVVVDVRLDEVVLRALEYMPERRYQQVSDVKTMCETIVATPPPPKTAPPADNLQNRDFELDIGDCLRQGWALVRSDFWPALGVTTLVIWLLGALGLLGGPLAGGWCLYFLKRLRREPVRLETAFAGFGTTLLPLFLVLLIGGAATGLGLALFVLPGLYLAGITVLALTLVIDRQLDFWTALKLSGTTVSKQWSKFLGFTVILALINFAGVFACGLGFFLSAPITLAAMIYAYEGIFGSCASVANKNVPKKHAKIAHPCP